MYSALFCLAGLCFQYLQIAFQRDVFGIEHVIFRPEWGKERDVKERRRVRERWKRQEEQEIESIIAREREKERHR